MKLIFFLTCSIYSNSFYFYIISIPTINSRPEGANHGPRQEHHHVDRQAHHPGRAPDQARPGAHRQWPQAAGVEPRGQGSGGHRRHAAEGRVRLDDRPPALREGLQHGAVHAHVDHVDQREPRHGPPPRQADHQRRPPARRVHPGHHRAGLPDGEGSRGAHGDLGLHGLEEQAPRGREHPRGPDDPRRPGLHGQGRPGGEHPHHGDRPGPEGAGQDVGVRLEGVRGDELQVQLLTDTLVPVRMTVHLNCRLLEPEHEYNILKIDNPTCKTEVQHYYGILIN